MAMVFPWIGLWWRLCFFSGERLGGVGYWLQLLASVCAGILMDLLVFFHVLASSLHGFQDVCQLLVSLDVAACVCTCTLIVD